MTFVDMWFAAIDELEAATPFDPRTDETLIEREVALAEQAMAEAEAELEAACERWTRAHDRLHQAVAKLRSQ